MTVTCLTCGKEVGEGVRCCAHCGAAVAAASFRLGRGVCGRPISQNIIRGEGGVCRWACDLHFFTNSTTLFGLWKIFNGVTVGMWLVTVLFDRRAELYS